MVKYVRNLGTPFLGTPFQGEKWFTIHIVLTVFDVIWVHISGRAKSVTWGRHQFTLARSFSVFAHMIECSALVSQKWPFVLLLFLLGTKFVANYALFLGVKFGLEDLYHVKNLTFATLQLTNRDSTCK